jgi:hypothetical protein
VTTPHQIQPSQKSLEKGRNAVEYTQKFLNMSLQEIWNIAYTSGYEDAMEIVKTDTQSGAASAQS